MANGQRTVSKNGTLYQKDMIDGYDSIYRKPAKPAESAESVGTMPEFLWHEFGYEIHHDDFGGVNGVHEDTESSQQPMYVLNDYWKTNVFVQQQQQSPTIRRPIGVSCIGLNGRASQGMQTDYNGTYISQTHAQYRIDNLVKWLTRVNFYDMAFLQQQQQTQALWFAGLLGLQGGQQGYNFPHDIHPFEALQIQAQPPQQMIVAPAVGFYVPWHEYVLKEPVSLWAVCQTFGQQQQNFIELIDTGIMIHMDEWYQLRIERNMVGDLSYFVQRGNGVDTKVATVAGTSSAIPHPVEIQQQEIIPFMGEVHTVFQQEQGQEEERHVFIDYDTIKLKRATDDPIPYPQQQQQ